MDQVHVGEDVRMKLNLAEGTIGHQDSITYDYFNQKSGILLCRQCDTQSRLVFLWRKDL